MLHKKSILMSEQSTGTNSIHSGQNGEERMVWNLLHVSVTRLDARHTLPPVIFTATWWSRYYSDFTGRETEAQRHLSWNKNVHEILLSTRISIPFQLLDQVKPNLQEQSKMVGRTFAMGLLCFCSSSEEGHWQLFCWVIFLKMFVT